MKIYTEEQVKVLISALDDIRDWDDDLEVGYDDAGSRAGFALNEFSHLTPIELPSDEEIEARANSLQDEKYGALYNEGINEGFYLGVEYIKKQILNQDK